jgi:hypothetical protein
MTDQKGDNCGLRSQGEDNVNGAQKWSLMAAQGRKGAGPKVWRLLFSSVLLLALLGSISPAQATPPIEGVTTEFADSGWNLGSSNSRGVALGDVDGDGDLDAFVANVDQANKVWVNNGGIFTDSGQSLGSSASRGVALGDLDGDGDLDAFVTNISSQANKVWVNNNGTFTDSGQNLGLAVSFRVALEM